jgi:hypothetical protein
VLQLELLLEGCDGVVPFTVKALLGEVDLSHLLVAHFLSGGIKGVINSGFRSQTLRRLGRFNQVTITSWLTKGFPLQFMLTRLRGFGAIKIIFVT